MIFTVLFLPGLHLKIYFLCFFHKKVSVIQRQIKNILMNKKYTVPKSKSSINTIIDNVFSNEIWIKLELIASLFLIAQFLMVCLFLVEFYIRKHTSFTLFMFFVFSTAAAIELFYFYGYVWRPAIFQDKVVFSYLFLKIWALFFGGFIVFILIILLIVFSLPYPAVNRKNIFLLLLFFFLHCFSQHN